MFIFKTHTDPAEKILQAALQEGYIPHRDDKFLIHGPGGVGKSSLIAIFCGTQRDLVRVSTPVATEPLHLTPIRDISSSRLTTDWQEVNYDRLSRMIAHTCHELFLQKEGNDGEKKREEGKKEKKEESWASAIAAGDTTQSLAFLASPSSSRRVNLCALASQLLSGLMKSFKKSPKLSLAATLDDDPENIEFIFKEFQFGLRNLVHHSKEANDVLFSHSIRLLDSGGQPQFHEIISIFLAGITGLVSVFKLSEFLSVHGEVAFYEKGMLTNEPYESQYTNEQVIRHDLQALQSEAIRCGIDELPNLAFVGTFLDEQHKCKETPDKKDERLHAIITEMLPPEMQECVITDGASPRRVTFRINARSPGKQDFDTVDRLKGALISRSRAKPRNLPLKWHSFEIVLHMLMKKLERYALTRRECEFIGHKLGFDPASLNAALNYLRELNIIAYYDVLPNIIFGSCQVILDKISELVSHSLELKKGHCVAGGAERKFLQQGIISLEFLKSPALSQHYRSGLFAPGDLLKILISQLIVSAVGEKEYIVPSVLEVSIIYPSSPIPEDYVRSSFILHFSKKSPMFGVYCCTISSLLSDAGWKLLTEDGEVVQVARNSFTFEVPMGLPGKLTFHDPISSYLDIVLELPASVAAEHSVILYPRVRDVFFTAIMKAMKTLHYDVQVPEVSYLCPEQSSRCSVIPHPAIVDDSQSFLKCSLKPSSVFFPLTDEQKMWLPNTNGE